MKLVRNLDEVDNKLSKFQVFIHKNFKLPIFLCLCSFFIFICYKIYNSSFLRLFKNVNYSMIFFAVSFFFFFLISLRIVIDLFGLIFGQKGQNILSSKADIK